MQGGVWIQVYYSTLQYKHNSWYSVMSRLILSILGAILPSNPIRRVFFYNYFSSCQWWPSICFILFHFNYIWSSSIHCRVVRLFWISMVCCVEYVSYNLKWSQNAEWHLPFLLQDLTTAVTVSTIMIASRSTTTADPTPTAIPTATPVVMDVYYVTMNRKGWYLNLVQWS